MDEVDTAQPHQRRLWRRIADYPLVAMLIAVVIFLVAVAIAIAVGKPLESMAQPARAAIRAAINIALVLAAYKLLIVRLGEHPRDDLRWQRESVRISGWDCSRGSPS